MTNKIRKNKRINLAQTGDDFVLGIICEKLRLVQYAYNHLSGLARNPSRVRLFELGRKDGASTPWKLIATDIYKIRVRGAKFFDRMVCPKIGGAELNRLLYFVNIAGQEVVRKKMLGIKEEELDVESYLKNPGFRIKGEENEVY
jgi:hypothetical protein